MSREIKFRAWDGEQMRYEFLVARPQFADALSILTNENFAKKRYGLKEWKVMQFTGKKDTKGKEIYEGDIYSVFGHEVVVRLENPVIGDGTVEIIGNIYENKELLNE
jgi:uncharacterized phage protein (TIGR01671 family)